jgi:ribonuclease VapC
MSEAVGVLDSFALIAFFQGEPGADLVGDALAAATPEAPLHMSEVNFAEVKYTMIRRSGLARWNAAVAEIEKMPLRLHPATHAHAERARELKSRHKMSLADAFAAALAEELDGGIITGDPEFRGLKDVVKLRWLGPA